MITQLKNLNRNISWATGILIFALFSACAGPKNAETGLSYNKHKKFEHAFYEGIKYNILEDYRNAEEQFVLAVDINPKSHAALYELSKLKEKRGEYSLAIEYALKCTENNETYNHWYYFQLAQLYQEVGRYEESSRVYQVMYKNEPEDAQLYLEAANQYVLARSYGDALSILDLMDEQFGISEESAYGKRYIHLILSDDDLAVQVIVDLVDTYPLEPKYKIMLAETYISVREYSAAIKLLENVVAEDKDRGQEWLMLAELYERTDSLEKAFECMKRAFAFLELDLEQKFQTFSPYFLKIRASESARKQAFVLSDILINTHAGEDRPLVLRSDIYNILDSSEKSRLYLLQALDINSSDFRTWNKLLNLDAKMNKPAFQLMDADKALELFPNIPSLYLAKAYAHFDLLEYEEAISTTELGLEIAVDQNDQIELFACKASALDKLGRYSESDIYYNKALRLDPNDFLTMNNYAYALAVRGDRLAYADSLINFALLAKPGNPYYLDTKAWVLFKQGNIEEAKKILLQAIIVDPLSPEYFEHLAEICLAEGNTAEALKYYKKAQELGSTNKDLQQLMNSHD